MRSKFLALAGAVASMGLANPVSAAAVDTNVPFLAEITSSCAVALGTPGTLAANANYSTLSSKDGGISGTASVVTTGLGFKISAIAPSSFVSAPTGGGDGVTFTASYETTGATSTGQLPGATTTDLSLGVTAMTVDLVADRASGAYPAGSYRAEVIVRCE